MEPYFREMFDGLKKTADGLILANEGIKKAVDAALRAKDEHEGLRETVQRLEKRVLDLVERMNRREGAS